MFYKAPDNSLHFLDDDSFAHLLPVGCVPITEVEAEAIRAASQATTVPQSVTRFQALAALHLAGHLPAVQAIIAAPETPILAKLAWDNALSFERTSPTLLMLAGAIGMTDADLDALFTEAAGLSA